MIFISDSPHFSSASEKIGLIPSAKVRNTPCTQALSITKTDGAVKIKPNISKSKYLSIGGYGALPHRPTKGLSARPLETFGQKYLVLFLKYQCCSLTAPKRVHAVTYIFRRNSFYAFPAVFCIAKRGLPFGSPLR